MKLIDLLCIIPDSQNVIVCCDGEIVSEYDGRDSIDEELNEREVTTVSCSMFGELIINIKED